MTISLADAPPVSTVLRAVIGFCADFCAGARQGGSPPSPPP